MSPRERLAARIRAEGPARVRDVLADALRDYYAKGPVIGPEGDFYTAANATLFPGALRRFVDAARERLGGDARVVELGGGAGHVAAALGDGVTIVEPSPGLAEVQRARGLHVAPSLDALEPAPTVFLANEVLDALPVHRLRRTEEGMRECSLDADLREVPGPLSRPELEEAAARLAPHLPVGCAAEVNLDAAHLLADLRRAAPRAIVLFLDYGGEPARLYGDHAPEGTLRGFHQHKVTPPYERLGEQDVTADVDFPWIEILAQRQGFSTFGTRTQGAFLADLGLLDDMNAALARGDVQAYLAAKNLLLPGGMGERFHALALAHGLPADPPLPGFRSLPGGFR